MDLRLSGFSVALCWLNTRPVDLFLTRPVDLFLRTNITGGSMVKNLPAAQETQGYLDSIPGSVRSPGEGNGNPVQYSCLEKSMDRSLVGYSSRLELEKSTEQWVLESSGWKDLVMFRLSPFDRKPLQYFLCIINIRCFIFSRLFQSLSFHPHETP